MFNPKKSVVLRVFSLLILLVLVVGPAAGISAQASPVEQDPGPEEPSIPASPNVLLDDHLVTHITLGPDSPNILRTNQNLTVNFNYATLEDSGVRIWVRPFTNGNLTPNYGAHGSPLYPKGNGSSEGWFTIQSGEVVVDEIRIQMKSEGTGELLFEAFLPVYYLFTDAPHAVTNFSLTPDTPDVLGFGTNVELGFDYITREKDGVRIFARPFTNGNLTPKYGAHGSPIHSCCSGSVGGSFTINSGNVVVDQIRIQMFNADQSVVLFEAFLPVYYRFMQPTNYVHHIEFNPGRNGDDTPNIFAYGENFNINFDYSNTVTGGVRIWARPFSGTNLTPNYGAHGSPLYGAGSGSGTGSFNLKSGPMVVDSVRIQMWNADNTSLLYEAFLPVHLLWAGSGPDEGPDIKIDSIEVTQAIQDLNNSVDLVAGKRTFVRVHVSSPANIADVFATLRGIKGWSFLNPTLTPDNPGGDITVLTSPDRGQLNDSFLFELPSGWISAGNLTLYAKLDPNGATFDPDTSDNTASVSVNFKDTPPLRLRLVNVQYTEGGNTYLENTSHLNALESWLRRAYPIDDLQVTRQTYVYTNSGLPDVDILHTKLALIKLIRTIFVGEDSRTVYYGVVDDGGGFMRGKAAGIPGTIAAGPSGTGNWGWDFDGSYNDWYGGHEIGHTRGRFHAEFCGAGGGVAYPYTGGRISPALTGDTAIYGFDITTRDIYGPDWRDVMTYCEFQWVSDFTYEGIRDYLVGTGMQVASIQSINASSFLVVVGLADLDDHTAALESVYQINQEATVPLPIPGDWTIALVDSGDSDLAAYAFSPNELTAAEDSPGTPAVISEIVPWVDGTAKIEIRYNGSVVATRSASENPPSVSIASPGAGVSAAAASIGASWTGSDPDGDPLTYTLLYSNDGGSNWQILVADLDATEFNLDTDSLPGGTGLLRVVASDGMLGGQDTSGPFAVPLHAPDAEIISPTAGQVFYPLQQVVLQGTAYDLEDGTMGDEAFEWSSNINGDLGSGAILPTTVLSTGEHIITLEVTDSDAMSTIVTQTIEISTEGAPELLNLDAAPIPVGVVAEFGDPIPPVVVTMRTSGETELDWTASENIPWLSIGTTSGTTPNDLTLTFDPGLMNVGGHTGVITFTSGDAVNSPVKVFVNVQIVGDVIYLPIVGRE